jgi:protein-tyrosine phosphatase
MVDIHHHLLPGLDDGAPDLETSLAMARIAVADGITHVVATPHANGQYKFSPAVVAERLAELRAALAAEGIALTVSTGCDFHLSYDNVQDATAHPTRYTLNGSNYLLIELPDHGLPPGLSKIYYDLRVAGMIPILTHPERNLTLQGDTRRLGNWMRHDMLLQVTAGSVLGHMGKKAETMAHKLLADRWVHFVATDAHNADRRPPKMAEAHALIASKYGQAYADRICVNNPRAVVEGRHLPDQDEPRGLFDERAAYAMPWWRRLFS